MSGGLVCTVLPKKCWKHVKKLILFIITSFTRLSSTLRSWTRNAKSLRSGLLRNTKKDRQIMMEALKSNGRL